ncbi:MAG: phenylacetate--CoA ligase family protein [Alphaproteobacteria bacterium]
MKLGAFLKARWQHTRNTRRPRAEIEALQLTKFRRLVAHANEHSPYYRDLIAARAIEIGNCVPTDFPPLTKQDAMENFDRIVTDRRITSDGVNGFLLSSRDPRDLFLDEFVVIHTSGTSSQIGFFVNSSTDWAIGTALAMRIFPFTLRRRRMASYGMTRGHFAAISHMAAGKSPIAKLRMLSLACDVNDPITATVERLNRFQPTTLSGYPTAVARLAEAQEAGSLRIAPEYIAVGGLPLTPEDRSLIDQAFGATILNHYGSTEHLTMGIGRKDYGGTYLFEDELIFEPDGERSYVTNLFNYTQPLIRYVMDDRLEIIDDPDPVFHFVKIRDIGGRTIQDPVFENLYVKDDVIASKTFALFFVPNVLQIQLEAFDKTSCVLRVRLKDGLSQAERDLALARSRAWLIATFANKEMENVSIRIDQVDHFSGNKFNLVVTPEMVVDPMYPR